jgi:hypothetical protein
MYLIMLWLICMSTLSTAASAGESTTLIPTVIHTKSADSKNKASPEGAVKVQGADERPAPPARTGSEASKDSKNKASPEGAVKVQGADERPAPPARTGAEQSKVTPRVITKKFSCQQNVNQRSVSIYRQTPDAVVPCEVIYQKDSERRSPPQVIYRSNTNAAICLEKAQAFVAKIKSWGWTCVEENL